MKAETTNKYNYRTVKEARQAGLKVRVKHYRYILPATLKVLYLDHVTKISKQILRKQKELIHPKGGKVVVELRDLDGREHIGEAICAKDDCFNRKVGLSIALGRAIKQANISQ